MIQTRSSLSLHVLCAWLFASAFYYAQTLFTGEFVVELNEGFAHKFFKYVACGAISTYLIMRARDFVVGGISLLLLMILSLHLMMGGAPNLFATTVLTLVAMTGFSCVFQVYPGATMAIARAVVGSAAIVGCLSVIELSLLAHNFIGYWSATGGVRSISTMFNPNNLGLYMGAALLVLPWAALSRRLTIALAIPILFGFGASGSRTAWVSLIFCIFVVFVSPRAGRGLRRGFIRYVGPLSILLAVALAVASLFAGIIDDLGIESERRGSDLYTANLRWTNFLAYVAELDETSLLPDISDARIDRIQDSTYLVLLNTFGMAGSFVLLMTLIIGMRLERTVPRNEQLAWRIIVMYYIISGLSGSFLNSFPNNQFFFVALGGVLVPRILFTRKGAPFAS